MHVGALRWGLCLSPQVRSLVQSSRRGGWSHDVGRCTRFWQGDVCARPKHGVCRFGFLFPVRCGSRGGAIAPACALSRAPLFVWSCNQMNGVVSSVPQKICTFGFPHFPLWAAWRDKRPIVTSPTVRTPCDRRDQPEFVRSFCTQGLVCISRYFATPENSTLPALWECAANSALRGSMCWIKPHMVPLWRGRGGGFKTHLRETTHFRTKSDDFGTRIWPMLAAGATTRWDQCVQVD